MIKKYVLKTTKFLIPTLIFVVLLEISLRFIPNEFSYKKKYLDKNANQIETLILGSSYTYFGVDPKFFTLKSFNAADVNRPIYFDYLIYDKYKDEFKNLKNIVIPISYSTFNSKLNEAEELSPWGSFNYYIYFGLPNKSSIRNNFEVLSMPFSSVREKISLYIQKRMDNNTNYGWSTLGWGNYYDSNHKIDMEKDGFKEKDMFDSISFKLNTIDFFHFAENLKNRDINLCIIIPPFYKTFKVNRDIKCVNETYNVLKEVTVKYNNCFFYDFSSDIDFIEEDFFDSNHLNMNGARKLSVKLNNIITNINK